MEQVKAFGVDFIMLHGNEFRNDFHHCRHFFRLNEFAVLPETRFVTRRSRCEISFTQAYQQNGSYRRHARCCMRVVKWLTVLCHGPLVSKPWFANFMFSRSVWGCVPQRTAMLQQFPQLPAVLFWGTCCLEAHAALRHMYAPILYCREVVTL
jgi:hypothetical protein